jgi:DnaJ-class molecular chaperone
MGKDYYQTLGLERGASEAEISKAYKTLALKWHPKLSKYDPDLTYHNFCEISEAYEVLGDSYKRAFFDKYGEEQLKDGFIVDGNFRGGYRFGGNPEEIFEKFFGSNNPFAHLVDDSGKEELGSMFGFAFKGLNYEGAKSIPNLEVPVDCTLNELYNGCSKEVTYTRVVLNGDGQTTRNIQETKKIEIRPGYSTKTVLSFAKQGNEAVGLPTSDLIFKIREVTHGQFKRRDNDLVYTATIKLSDALVPESIVINTLDFRHLHVSLDQIITPKYVKRVEGEGMPIPLDETKAENYNKALQRGDLYIKFDIQFPTSLTEDQKQAIKHNLP